MKRTAILLLVLSVIVLSSPPGAADPPGGTDPSDGGGTIVRFDFVELDGDLSGGYKVLYNPEKVEVKKTIPWREGSKPGHPKPTWTHSKMLMLQLDLTFDTSEEGDDVSKVTDAIKDRATAPPGDGDGSDPAGGDGDSGEKGSGDEEPQRFKVILDGTYVYDCVLWDSKTIFTMFKEDGTPVRAKVSCTFTEFLPEKPKTKGE